MYVTAVSLFFPEADMTSIVAFDYSVQSYNRLELVHTKFHFFFIILHNIHLFLLILKLIINQLIFINFMILYQCIYIYRKRFFPKISIPFMIPHSLVSDFSPKGLHVSTYL